jgi:hypothetical protein
MKYRKFNKYEKKEVRRTQIAEAMSGTGTYIFQNSSNNAELTLPRATHSGRRKIEGGGQFQGDSYYLQMVKTGLLKIVEVIQTPLQEKEADAMNQKLILDQPDQITESGKVEHVVEQKTTVQKMNEGGNEKKPDILLNEGPSADGFIIVG